MNEAKSTVINFGHLLHSHMYATARTVSKLFAVFFKSRTSPLLPFIPKISSFQSIHIRARVRRKPYFGMCSYPSIITEPANLICCLALPTQYLQYLPLADPNSQLNICVTKVNRPHQFFFNNYTQLPSFNSFVISLISPRCMHAHTLANTHTHANTCVHNGRHN